MTGDTWPDETGNCCCIDSNDRCGLGDGVVGDRADDVARLGAGVWRGLGPRGFNLTDRSHQAWVDLMG